MICPLCEGNITPPPMEEEIFHSASCDSCIEYEVEFWDRQIQQEIVILWIGLERFKIIFDRAKNETQVLKIFCSEHERDWQEWTEHVITLPPIKEIPNLKELEQKVKIWLTFS